MSEIISYRDPAPKIITFDCYGTLVQWCEIFSREINATLQKLGVTDVSAMMVIDRFSAQGRPVPRTAPG